MTLEKWLCVKWMMEGVIDAERDSYIKKIFPCKKKHIVIQYIFVILALLMQKQGHSPRGGEYNGKQVREHFHNRQRNW